MPAIRVNLFFPEDHPLANIPKDQRAAKAKELIEFALKHEDQVNQLQFDISEIKSNLAEIKAVFSQGVNFIPAPPTQSKEMADADLELIKSFIEF